jgi:4-hydroxybenzoate polyprenyltransferase
MLDGIVVAVVALVAGAVTPVAIQLGVSTVLLQFAIGAGNDVADASRDAGRAGKPIPSGLVSRRAARSAVVVCAAAGLSLALLVSPLALVVAALGLSVGAAYDTRLKGTPFSWLPMAIGVPLLPVYGWLGATGGLPALFLVLVPLAATAGAALAVANAVVDVERDLAAGSGSVATLMGVRRASEVALALQVVVAVLALVTGSMLGTPFGWRLAVGVSSLVPVGGALLGVVAAVRGHSVGERELAWEVQAVGLGLLAVAWVSGLGASMADHLGG